LALQLVNIARDVGEDLERDRVYLPLAWLAAEGLEADELMRHRSFDPRLAPVVERVLRAADHQAELAWPGIAALPARTRPAVRAAGRMYLGIGDAIRARGMDSVSGRAYLSLPRKLLILGSTLFEAKDPRGLTAPAPESTRFLVEACAR
jgi:phytoene synthase